MKSWDYANAQSPLIATGPASSWNRSSNGFWTRKPKSAMNRLHLWFCISIGAATLSSILVSLASASCVHMV